MAGQRDPWIIRTYAGFGDANETNRRYRDNLERGQRGLSVAFDLVTQCGYDADHAMARGEVGQTGVSVAHLGDMQALFDQIDLGAINTSMTINATAPWLYALYLALADQRGIPRAKLRGTTQNDLLKEFVARGTSIFDPGTSFRLSTDLIAFAVQQTPRWNPVNCCGYHLMESGAGPEEEVGYALLGAILLIDGVRPGLDAPALKRVVEAVSFFVNSGIELVPEIAKMRAYARLWPALCQERYGVTPRFRAGCQVRSLSLTAQQPEVNIVRIALQALPVIASASARVGALQLPGFREAIALPDDAEQTLGLRTQQVLMHETGLCDWPDIFEGSGVIEGETARIEAAARDIVAAGLQQGYERTIDGLASLLSRRMAAWQQRIESGEQTLVGVNRFTEAVPLTSPPAAAQARPADALRTERSDALRRWRQERDAAAWQSARTDLVTAARAGTSIIEASVAFARAGGTTGEWTDALLSVFGPRYSAPLGVDAGAMGSAGAQAARSPDTPPMRILLAKAGLDGHVNALRVLAVALRDAGIEVVYGGLACSPEALARTAVSESVDAIGISSLSGSHLLIVEDLQRSLAALGETKLPIAIGGIIPERDHAALRSLGVQQIFTPGQANLSTIVAAIRKMVRP